jgi:hypothetical protein
MKRFELDSLTKTGYSRNGDYYSNWWPTNDEVILINWLNDRVETHGYCSYVLPFRTTKWGIYLGYGDDPNLDDFSWRHLGYKPKGKFGYWLEIQDDMVAVELLLSGILHPCLYTGERPHRDHAVEAARLTEYPKKHK